MNRFNTTAIVSLLALAAGLAPSTAQAQPGFDAWGDAEVERPLHGQVAPIQGYGRVAPTGGAVPADVNGPTQRGRMVVNSTPLTLRDVNVLRQLGIQPIGGRFWYDPQSGAWGVEGEGTAGLLPPGLGLGGPLRANASNGRSRRFVNGRQLTGAEVTHLSQLVGTPLRPGRYWLDAQGNAGREGGPAVVNLYGAGQQRSRFHHGKMTGISVSSQGG